MFCLFLIGEPSPAFTCTLAMCLSSSMSRECDEFKCLILGALGFSMLPWRRLKDPYWSSGLRRLEPEKERDRDLGRRDSLEATPDILNDELNYN